MVGGVNAGGFRVRIAGVAVDADKEVRSGLRRQGRPAVEGHIRVGVSGQHHMDAVGAQRIRSLPGNGQIQVALPDTPVLGAGGAAPVPRV